MTPTFLGRIHTRLLLVLVIGLPWSLVIGFLLRENDRQLFGLPLIVLGVFLFVGIVWDVIYIAIQQLRWDRDWPYAFQFLIGITEGLLLYWLTIRFVFPSLMIETAGDPSLTLFGDLTSNQPREVVFLLHYLPIFLLSFGAVFGPLRVFLPQWRYKGGQF